MLFGTNFINEVIRNNKFPDSLKNSDIRSAYKKFDPSDKANYRPVSVLPLLSKVLFMRSFMNIWETSWVSYCVIFEKHIPHNMLFSGYFRHCTKNEVFHDFFSKCDQIRSFLRIWSHLLRTSLMKNFIFCAVRTGRSAWFGRLCWYNFNEFVQSIWLFITWFIDCRIRCIWIRFC